MANPSVNVTINATDNASPAIQKLNGMARAASEQVNNQLKGIGAGFNSNALIGAKLAFTGFAVHAVSEIRKVMNEMSTMRSRMEAFGGATAAEARQLQDTALQKGAKLPGGAVAYQKAEYSGMKANLTPQQAAVVAPHGVRFGQMTGVSPDQGMENLTQIMGIWQYFRDKDGNITTPDKMDPKLLDAAYTKARGRYIEEAKTLPGRESDLFDFYKMAGPVMQANNIPEHEQRAFAQSMAQGGFGGSHAGVYARGFTARILSPNNKGRAAMEANGMSPNDYFRVNQNAIDPEQKTKAVEAQTGKLDAAARAKVLEAQRMLKSGELSLTQALDATADAITGQESKSGKGVLDRAKAQKIATDVAVTSVDKVDVMQLFKDAKDKKANSSFFRSLMGLEAGTGGQVAVMNNAPQIAEDFKNAPYDPAENVRKADAAMDANINAATERVKNTLQSTGLTMMQPLEAVIIQGANAISGILDGFNSASEATKAFGTTIVGITGGAAFLAITRNALTTAGAILSLGNAATVAAARLSGTAMLPAGAAAAGGVMGRAGGALSSLMGGPIAMLGAGVFATYMGLRALPPMSENMNPRTGGRKKSAFEYEDDAPDSRGVNRRFASGNAFDHKVRGETRRFLNELNGAGEDAASFDKPKAANSWADSIPNGTTQAPAAGDAKWGSTTITGTMTGEGIMRGEFTVIQSPLLEVRLSRLESGIIGLKGQIGNSKTGVNLAGSNGAQPVASNPSGGQP